MSGLGKGKEEQVQYDFKKPEEIPPETLCEIEGLIKSGGGVLTSLVSSTLRRAFLIGYATHRGRVIGTSTHKQPQEAYRKKIEAATGLDLSGYLERGYTVVAPGYRHRGIGTRLIQGLVERSSGRKIYVTIRLDNEPPLRMTRKARMILAGRFVHEMTGHEIGLFVNFPPEPPEPSPYL